MDHTPNNIWQGKSVRLRAVEPADWKTFGAWDQDSQLQRLTYHVTFTRSEEATRSWTANEATSYSAGDVYRWVIENTSGEMVGTLNTHSCDPRNGTFAYGIAIAKEHWRKGYASEAISLVLRYY